MRVNQQISTVYKNFATVPKSTRFRQLAAVRDVASRVALHARQRRGRFVADDVVHGTPVLPRSPVQKVSIRINISKLCDLNGKLLKFPFSANFHEI